jgi:DNA topoisomerase-1
MIFDGFMIIYTNSSDDSEEDGVADVKFGKIEKNTILNMDNLTATEEYTKPPPRFNEASLIKHLEKLGIGRPSTYAAIISKIVDRKYVELGNIDGVKKNSVIITLSSKLKLTEKSKEIVIGREKNKIIPTAMGTKVNNFLIENFTEIMDIEFTAKMEKLLDKIASGDKKWYKVLESFYDRFSPKIDKLALEYKDSNYNTVGKDDILLGKDKEGNEIYKAVAKYGPVVKVMEDSKWKYGPIKKLDGVTYDNIKLEKAIEILSFPIYLGKHKNSKVYLNRGEYGLYLKHGTSTTPIKNKDLSYGDISLELASELIEKHDSDENKIKLKDKIVYIKNGPYGAYLTYMKGKKRINIKLPENLPIDKISKEDCEALVNQKRKWSKKKKSS